MPPVRQDALERPLAVADDVRFVSVGFEIEAQALGEVLLVLDDQDARHRHRASRPQVRIRADASLGSSIAAVRG